MLVSSSLYGRRKGDGENARGFGREMTKVTLVDHWAQKAGLGDHGYMVGHCTNLSTA